MDSIDPGVLAQFDQEMFSTRAWLTHLAKSWPQAVERYGDAIALTTLARHIESRVYSSGGGPPPTGWMVAAVAVTALSQHLHSPAELPPLNCELEPEPEPCCGDHVDHCVAPAYPCCDDCPDQGD